MPGLLDWFGNNSYGIDAAEAEKTVRSKLPHLLHKDEHIELAFKSAFDAREKSYLTTHRILLKRAVIKTRIYQSIPYTSIQAFSVETAGTLDDDTELKIWSSAFGGDCKVDFVKDEVDLWAIQQFMNYKVVKNFVPAGTQDKIHSTPVDTNNSSSKVGQLVDWLGDNASGQDPQAVEDRLKTQYPVLMDDEKVELAFQGYRDYVIFTDKRLLLMDVKGVTGKKVQFMTIFWQSVHGFAVETAGTKWLDRDTKVIIYTNIVGYSKVEQDLRDGKADLWAIKNCINNKVLGHDTATLTDIDHMEGYIDPSAAWWQKENNRPLDAAQMNEVFHSSPPILRSTEVVEMAFKGWRDVILFTTHRVVKVDPKGFTGKRVEYTSIPWRCILAFAVQTAGTHIDFDSEAIIWTEMDYHHSQGKDDPDLPEMSKWKLGFNKRLVDIIAVNKYLATRVLHSNDALHSIVPLAPNTDMISTEEQGVEKFLNKIGSDQIAIDPNSANELFHTDLPMLLGDETVVMAFKAGRDSTLFTNLRIIVVDVKGWTGRKVKYQSLPYTCIRAFAVESAGSWDRDAELKIYTRNRWYTFEKKSLDFRAGAVDILVIQKFLSAMLMGSREDAKGYFDNPVPSVSATREAMSMSHFFAWFTSDSTEQTASFVSDKLHSEPPLLLEDEVVEKAYKAGRDLHVYTNNRYIKIDSQGLSGKKVKYFSMPFQWVMCFDVATAGTFDLDAEVFLRCNVTRKKVIKQDIRVNKGDVMHVHKYLTERLMFPDAERESLLVDEATAC